MKNKVTVVFYDVNEEIAEENLWIEKKGDLEYQIKNIPFFAPNLAYDDIISVEEDDGNYYFEDIITPSEHSTIQIIFFDDRKIKEVINNIEQMDCFWEGIDGQKILAVDIPPHVNYGKVKDFLEKMLFEQVFDYKEACLSETHQNNV